MAVPTRQLVPSRLAELPTTLVACSAELARQHVVDALAAADAREQHYVVLAALHEVGPTTSSQLARDTGLDRADVAATVGILERKRYVERASDATDGRRTLLTVTPAGRQHLDRLDELYVRAQAAFLADLTNTDRSRLVRLLSTLVTQRGRR